PENSPGILDFQDGVYGPITYDLVSLLRDCYIVWPASKLDMWFMDYYMMARKAGLLDDIDQVTFRRWFDWMGLQRHIKIAGIFARLNHRDGKPAYLNDIPTALQYILDVGSLYSEMDFLTDFIARQVLPNFRAKQ
ncbi:MAG: aminoglycoside phosphotransferase, partial [Pseudomonadota bacterium]